VTNTRSLARAMLHVAEHGHDQPLLENPDVNTLAGS